MMDSLGLWLFEAITLGAALFFILRRRDFARHRICMTYNYAGQLSIPLWWVWEFVVERLGVTDYEAAPNLFQLMFVTCALATVSLFAEFTSSRSAVAIAKVGKQLEETQQLIPDQGK